MLTNEKLDVYERYSGSNDFWLRMGSEAELSLLQSSDWQMLYLYTDNIELAKNGLLADSFLKQHEADMLANCESAEVVERLKEITYKLSKKPGLFWRLWNKSFDWIYKLIS